MSEPKEADEVKLITSLFSPEQELLAQVIRELEDVFGPIDWRSPECFFDRTRYYEKEMGWPLHRRFVSYKKLIKADELAPIKWKTNALENHYRVRGRRRINIDPGYISLERLVLATGKNYTHRIYLSRGIYADLTLIFHRGSFSPLEWTYKDYATPDMIGFFNGLRERYKNQIRGLEE